MDKQWRNRVTVAFLAVTVLVIAMMLSGTLHRTPRITLPSGMQAAGQTVVGGETPTVDGPDGGGHPLAPSGIPPYGDGGAALDGRQRHL